MEEAAGARGACTAAPHSGSPSVVRSTEVLLTSLSWLNFVRTLDVRASDRVHASRVTVTRASAVRVSTVSSWSYASRFAF